MGAFDSKAACSAPASLSQTLSFLCEEGVCSAPSVTKYFPSPHREMKHEESVGSLKSISSGRSSKVFSCNTSQSWAITTIYSKPAFIPWVKRFKSCVRVWTAQLSFYKYSSQGLSLLVKGMLDGSFVFFGFPEFENHSAIWNCTSISMFLSSLDITYICISLSNQIC